MKIWADGGCEPNPGMGGWGWHRSDGKFAHGGSHETTNNRMEMTAILEAMRALSDGSVATIYSDSQYCVNGLTIWHEGWRRKNWLKKGEPMLNRDLWLDLHKEITRLNITMEWVRGHNGDPGNERADALAGMGRDMVLVAGHQLEPT